jgi:hypothetical protein
MGEWKFPDGKVIRVGVSASVAAYELPMFQICHHLNPDFMQCDNYDSISRLWVLKDFKNAANIRSCSLEIENGQEMLHQTSSRGCLYCGLLCIALSYDRPG